MRPGEIIPGVTELELHAGRARTSVTVRNTSRWCVQVASHVHFFEVNRNLVFDRVAAFGMHLDVPAGRAERWDPGEEKTVGLVAYGGAHVVHGFNGLCDGPATPDRLEECLQRARERGFVSSEA